MENQYETRTYVDNLLHTGPADMPEEFMELN